MKGNSLLITGVVVAIVVAAAFFAGMKYQQSKTPQGGQFAGRSGNGQGRGPGASGGRFGTGGGRPVFGQILSADVNTITVKMNDGSSKIVIIPNSVTINRAASGTRDDLKVGTRVGVFGSQNADGSVTAQNIQLNPVFGEPNAGSASGSSQIPSNGTR